MSTWVQVGRSCFSRGQASHGQAVLLGPAASNRLHLCGFVSVMFLVALCLAEVRARLRFDSVPKAQQQIKS